MMRWGVSILGFAAGSTLVLAAGCASEEFEGCGTAVVCAGSGGSAGASGVSGSGGSGGTGQAAGSSGTVGESGATGQGGAAGSELGSGGRAGAGTGKGGASGSGNSSGEGGSTGEAGATGASGDGGEAGATGGAGGGETPCDATASPGEDTCVIDEEYGVFVSPAGDDGSGEGTKALPFATIGKAIEVATADGRRVYACADGGEYKESVTLGAEASGLEMFGGFSCADWSYGANVKSVVRAAGPEALRVAQVEGLLVENFGFVAADATVVGGSSVAAQVVNSTGVVFRRVRLEAGKGMEGADGVRVDFVLPDPRELDGNDAIGSQGGAAKLWTCPDGSPTLGGAGGNTQPGGAVGGNGTPDWGGGQGGPIGSCTNGFGRDGVNAPPRENASGAAIRGVLSTAGWTPSAGGDGEHGFPGQGGGGGAGLNGNPAGNKGAGGGGGCGGCGGAGGPGGGGGGASIALAVFESELMLSDSELSAADAGDGGSGEPGHSGQLAGGFRGIGEGGDCSGGYGGYGGDGGNGGGGAGGVSVGVLWSGEMEPTLTDNEFTLGDAGAIGIGGDPGVNDGIAGRVQEVLEVP